MEHQPTDAATRTRRGPGTSEARRALGERCRLLSAPVAITNRRTRTIIACVAALGAGALVAGCGDDEDESASTRAAPAASTAPAAPASFAIEATADGKKKKLAFPASVKAGLVTLTLTNSDKSPRSAGIVRLLDDHTVEEFEKAVDKEGAPIPAWIEDGGGVAGVKPGQSGSVTQVLAPGEYGITDQSGGEGEGPSNSDLGARGEFTVTGPPSDAELPDQPATLTATDDGQDEYGFEFDGLKAGVNQVRFENTGKELHHAIIFPINEGKTIADVTAAFASDEPPKGPPPVDFENGLGTQVIDGGIAQNLELEFKPGKYAVVCFVQDRKGGKPHVAQGMIDELTIE